jgi:hypothetical protein
MKTAPESQIHVILLENLSNVLRPKAPVNGK